jgi:mannose-6-phosphate isomerase-like protein (cupin superfamily)
MAASVLTPALVLAQDAAPGRGRRDAPVETWLTEKPINAKPEWKAPNRPIWRLADLKKAHAGQNNWSQLIVQDIEQEATYNSGAPGTKIAARMHPDTPTVFVVISGQVRFTVEGQQPVVATRTSMINIMKSTAYSYEVIGGENALWIEVNVRGYSTRYPVDGPAPAAARGDEIVKVEFPRAPAPYSGINKLHFNTLEAIANCTVGPAIADDRMYLTPNTVFVNPADDKCRAADAAGARRGGRGGGEGGGAEPLDYKGTFGHLHSGAVEWWIIQLGGISGTFEDQGEFHAVEGDVMYAPPATWHQMRPEGPSGPSVRVTMGAYQRLNMNSIPPAKP